MTNESGHTQTASQDAKRTMLRSVNLSNTETSFYLRRNRTSLTLKHAKYNVLFAVARQIYYTPLVITVYPVKKAVMKVVLVMCRVSTRLIPAQTNCLQESSPPSTLCNTPHLTFVCLSVVIVC